MRKINKIISIIIAGIFTINSIAYSIDSSKSFLRVPIGNYSRQQDVLKALEAGKDITNFPKAVLYTKTDWEIQRNEDVMMSLINNPLSRKEDILKRQRAVELLIEKGLEKISSLQRIAENIHQWAGTYKYFLEYNEEDSVRMFHAGKDSKVRLTQFIEEGLINKTTVMEDIKKAREAQDPRRDFDEREDEATKRNKILRSLSAINDYKGMARELADSIKEIAGKDGFVLNGLAEDLQNKINITKAPDLIRFIELFEKRDGGTINELLANLKSLTESVNNISAFLTFSSLAINDEYTKANFDETKPAGYKKGWLFTERKKARKSYFREEEEKDQVLNDGPSDIPVAVLTGSNMSGKSHYLKQNFFIQLLGQSFGYVPAESANLHIYSHIAYLDRPSTDSYNDLSAFGKEIENWKPVVKQTSNKSIIFVDEGYSTTSPEGQAQFLKATGRFIKDKSAHLMIATHNEEFIKALDNDKESKLYHFGININGDQIEFLHKLREGSSDSRALEVAQALGLPKNIINRAKEFLDGNSRPVTPNPERKAPLIIRYTEKEREELKKKTGDFLGVFPAGNALDIKGDGRMTWRYKNSEQSGNPESLPEPIFKRFSKDRDFFSSFSPMAGADYGEIKNSRYLKGIRELLIKGLSNDPKEILERQKMFKELVSSPKLRESINKDLSGIGDLMYAFENINKVELDGFNLQFLNSFVLNGDYEVYFKEELEMFLGILEMNLKLTGLSYKDIQITEEIQSIQAILALYEEYDALLKEDDYSKERTKARQKAMKKIPEKLDAITGEKNKRKYGYHSIINFAKHLKPIAEKINKKAQKNIPKISLFDKEKWPIIREEIEKIYPLVEKGLERGMGLVYNDHSIGMYYMRSLLKEENYSQKLIEDLKSADSVHLHQFGNYFEKFLKKSFGEFPTGTSYLEYKSSLPGKISEIEKEIRELESYQESLERYSADEILEVLRQYPQELDDIINNLKQELESENIDIARCSKYAADDPEDTYWRESLKESQKEIKKINLNLKYYLLIQDVQKGKIAINDKQIDQDAIFKLVQDKFVGNKIRKLSWSKHELEDQLRWYTPFDSGILNMINEEIFKLSVILATAYIIDYQNWQPVELTDKLEIEIKDGWNLVKTKEEQVPLSLRMDDKEKVKLFSGSNMSGKTFAEKTLLWNVAAGLSTGYAPNKGMKMPVFNSVIYIDRVTAQIDRKLSSFGHEIQYWKGVLKNTEKDRLVLVVIDEMGSTTSPKYQSALSYAMSEEILEKGHFLVVASHNHVFLDAFSNINKSHANIYHLRTEIDKDGKAVFDYIVEPGHELSNSLNVAKTMGLTEITKYIELLGQAI